jgi:outer membrane autotransporter protein
MKNKNFVQAAITARSKRKSRSGTPNLPISSAMVVLGLLAVSGSAKGQVSFGAANNFAVLAATTITNSGPTVIYGDVGLFPGSSITGFPPGIVNGTIHNTDTLAGQAQESANNAYNNLSGLTTTTGLTGQDLGGMVLTAGIYTFNSSAQLTGTLTLNTGANPNAVFVFQIGSTLTTGVGSSVVVTGAGALNNPNVYWQVGSSATINGGTVFDGSIVANTSISLGTGAAVVNGRLIALHGAVTLLSNTIMLAESSVPVPVFTSIADLTTSQRSAATALDYYTAHNTASAATIFLSVQNPANLPSMYDLIVPGELTAIFQIGFSGADLQNSNIERHLELVRQGDTGYLPPERTDSKSGMDSKGGLGSKSGMVGHTPLARESDRWSIFLEGSGSRSSVGSTNDLNGYDYTSTGVTLGADLRVNDHFSIGIMSSYANSNADLDSGGGIDIQSYKSAVFATVYGGGFYADGLLGGGYNSYDITRPSLLGFAHGSPNGWELDTLTGGGYDFHRGAWTFGPTTSVAYTRMTLNGFTETGSLTPLRYPSQSQDSLRTNLGARIAYTATVDGIKITPQVRVAWQHEFLDSTQSITSQLVSENSSPFTVNGPQIGRDRAVVSAGLNVQVTPTINLYAYYDGQLGSSNCRSNNVTVGVKIDF